MPKGHYTRKPRKNAPQPQPETGSPEPQETVTAVRPAHIDSGDDARGSTNARTNQTRTQPEPEPALRAMGEVVSLRKRGKTPDLRKEIEAELSAEVAAKVQREQEARQHLAQAIDLLNEGADKEKEASELIDRACLPLYRCRIEGTMSADSLTGLLGDLFGFKDKTDSNNSVPAGHKNASKTPFKRGEAIRKRIVRAVQAHEYVNGRDGGAFFNDLPKDAVAATLNSMTDGTTGFWAAYEGFATIKREHDAAKDKIDPAYDPKKVAAMAEKVNEEGTAKRLLDNPELLRSYVALVDLIDLAIEKAGTLRKAA